MCSSLISTLSSLVMFKLFGILCCLLSCESVSFCSFLNAPFDSCIKIDKAFAFCIFESTISAFSGCPSSYSLLGVGVKVTAAWFTSSGVLRLFVISVSYLRLASSFWFFSLSSYCKKEFMIEASSKLRVVKEPRITTSMKYMEAISLPDVS